MLQILEWEAIGEGDDGNFAPFLQEVHRPWLSADLTQPSVRR
jgi:hypothetical protein